MGVHMRMSWSGVDFSKVLCPLTLVVDSPVSDRFDIQASWV